MWSRAWRRRRQRRCQSTGPIGAADKQKPAQLKWAAAEATWRAGRANSGPPRVPFKRPAGAAPVGLGTPGRVGPTKEFQLAQQPLLERRHLAWRESSSSGGHKLGGHNSISVRRHAAHHSSDSISLGARRPGAPLAPAGPETRAGHLNIRRPGAMNQTRAPEARLNAAPSMARVLPLDWGRASGATEPWRDEMILHHHLGRARTGQPKVGPRVGRAQCVARLVRANGNYFRASLWPSQQSGRPTCSPAAPRTRSNGAGRRKLIMFIGFERSAQLSAGRLGAGRTVENSSRVESSRV